ncbi:MAG: gamma-glutamylcysteine synthetase [Desulfuromonas sp.]|mgnify:CR=1 FL=1|uniref:glutamate--cysteine ligase n=1 Tax=Desulfuromonas sp. TaxID=892 RepID=UPI000CA93D0A|nr:glutamate-cysteine ligase family protein [Desulfuromonas sp.]PLX83170.1 MAG: gamma-glutamylcysteine synthetase [Desulfuromonas sp.]
MTTLVKPNLDRPVASPQDLVDYLAHAAKPRERWGIGAELEKLVVDERTGEAASFEQIERFLGSLEQSGRWQGIREEGRLIALVGKTSSITLEPGGQMELSGRLCPDIHCCQVDFARHIDQVLATAKTEGLAFLGLGVQPFSPLTGIDLVPKERYGVMAPYMKRTGEMGLRMMKQTASLQVNLDFSDEADCIAKLRLSLSLAPLLYALFANSPILEGRPSGFLSTRGEIWSRTDPDRTGLIPPLFEEGAGFAAYVDWALDVPMYFIARRGTFLDMTKERFTFRRFMAEGFAGHRPLLADWDLHLSTLFPEARLRPQIEIRSADSLLPEQTMAMAALVKGLLYGEESRQEIWALFRNQDAAERDRLWRQSWRLGLKTPMGKRTLREVALEALDIARRGLRAERKRDAGGADESIYLEGIEEIAESGVTLAERLLAQWTGSRREQLATLMAHCRFGG